MLFRKLYCRRRILIPASFYPTRSFASQLLLFESGKAANAMLQQGIFSAGIHGAADSKPSILMRISHAMAYP
jgi:hypothetical protein